MPVPPGHSSSVDSTSSFSSSKSSLLARPVDISSQSDIADPNPLYMSRTDPYGVAASPSQAISKPGPAASATQKFKRAFGKRRRPSHDPGTLLSSGDERYTSDFGPSSSSSNVPSASSVAHSFGSRPSAAKLTMHLFSGRKPGQASTSDSNEPPPLPPKPPALRANVPSTLHMAANIANKLSTNASGSRPRSSVMATSPSINAAIQFMREDEECQRIASEQRRETTRVNGELEQYKEDWRKSDSTMASSHTVKPTHPPDLGPCTARASPEESRLESWPLDASVGNVGRQSKRRSISPTVHVPSKYVPASTSPSTSTPSTASSHSPPFSTPDAAAMRSTHAPVHSISLTSSPRDTPYITRTPANGIISTGTASGAPVSKANIRGRLAALTATASAGQRSQSSLAASTSSPTLTSVSDSSLYPVVQHRRVPVTSTGSQPSPDMQAVAAVRKLQNRMRSPSIASSSSGIGIRQAATSLTSGAGAMALGLGKRAYEKVGRVWGSSGSGSSSGYGSDTPSNRYPKPASVTGFSGTHTVQPSPPSSHLNHGPSAFPLPGRRTPNAPSGTWSISSLGASRSSSEYPTAGGRDTPSSGSGASGSGGLGRLVRPARGAGGGAVFGRELWECVRETRATVLGAGGDALTSRMIPALVLRCSRHLHKWGLEEEGLFRISGRSSHINRLRHEFDSGADYDIADCSPSELDPHAVASVFKAYLRELPEPILTHALSHLFDAAMSAESSRAVPTSASGIIQKTVSSGGPVLPSGPRAIPMLRRPPSLSTFTLPTSSSLRAPSASLLEALGDLVSRLPRENRDLLQTVVELMKATAERSKETKMPLSNLLLVFCPSLSMGPTLLRVLCDAPGIWDRAPPISGLSHEEPDESDDSESDSDSGSEVEQVVALPPKYKGKGREASIEPFTIPTSFPVPPGDAEEGLSDGRPRAVRRVPVPTFHLEDQHLQSSGPFVAGSFTPPSLADPLPRIESTPSLEVPRQGSTPSLSPPQPAVSPASVPRTDNGSLISSLRNRQFPLPLASSGFAAPISGTVPNHDKALPASPRASLDMTNQDRAGSAPQLTPLKEAYPERTSSLPTSLVLASHSAPSVVFPSAKTAPTTPTSPKKHTLTLSIGRSPKFPNDENMPSPSKRLSRRPSFNMLLNLTRSGSPSPRSRTPFISSPISSPVSMAQSMSSVESSPETMGNPFPPVLRLPIDGSIDDGLGWDDIFGPSDESTIAPPQPRSTAVSQPSSQSPWSQVPPSPSRRPTTEHLASLDGIFSSNGPPQVMPSASAVLEAADSVTIAPSSSSEDTLRTPGGIPCSPGGIPFSVKDVPSSPNESTSVRFPDFSSPGDDFPAVDFSVRDKSSTAPHLSFQLRRSSLEDDDWAGAVLMAAGKPGSPC